MDSHELAAEHRRIKEVARYYCTTPFPPNDNGSPLSPDIHEPCISLDANPVRLPSADPTRPAQISSEPALTGLAQLGALKLNCQRAFISVIDHNTQFLLAEATRSVSLLDQHCHDEGDALYLGVQSLPLYFGVCPGTIKVFTDPEGKFAISNTNVVANMSRYIIYDFTKDPDIKSRPYVAGWPFMRFYAEVPLRSPAGYVIGSYCVIDDQPRSAFGDREVATLQEISDLIANHLHFMRMRKDLERAERLMKGLSHFVERNQSSIGETASTELESSPLQLQHQNRRPEASHESTRLTADVILSSEDNSFKASRSDPMATSPYGSSSGIHETRERSMEPMTNISARPYINQPAHEQKRQLLGAGEKTIHQSSLVPTSIQETFRRASSLIRESMDLCGMIFFDAYLSDLAPRKTSQRGRSSPSHPDGEADWESSSDDESLRVDILRSSFDLKDRSKRLRLNPKLQHLVASKKFCESLGYSTRSNAPLTKSNLSLPEALLQTLSRRYPHGHIFNSRDSGHVRSSSNLDAISTGASPSRKRKRDMTKQAEAALLFDLFPEARSVIFFPLWDSQKSRWYAGALGWTTDPKRALQSEEITYLAAFGNSIMSEVSRLEAVATDRAKSDFISSISHELRSPLHGILASAELLQESSTGPDQDGLIEMINSCGRTLLDTMNHLLDYAKINNFTKAKNKDSGLVKNNHSMSDQMGLVSTFNLSELVEEVVEAVHTGHNFQKKMAASFRIGDEKVSEDSISSVNGSTMNKEPQSLAGVSVILDIGESVNRFFTSEAGAWRRIVMNIFGNALKYTQSGFIKVSVHALESTDSILLQQMVRLSISDTGKGISEEYLKHRLYTPFAQEDNLALGAGLGLSIVQQIVLTLGGTVSIESQLRKGTTVTVSIPLEMAIPTALQQRGPDFPTLRSQCQSLTVCFLGFNRPANCEDDSVTVGFQNNRFPQSAVAVSSLERTLSDWFGLRTYHAKHRATTSANIFVIEQDHMDRLLANETDQDLLLSLKDLPLIVLAATPSHNQKMSRRSGGVQFVSQPFGPAKLAKILRNCLEYRPYDSDGNLQASSIISSSDKIQVEAGLGLQSKFSAQRRPSNIRGPPSFTSLAIHSPRETTVTTSKKPKILLVDDNDINLKILVTCVRKLDCLYETASDGQQALDKYKQSTGSHIQFDYVLMDVSMPVMDGLTCTSKIRAFELEQHIPPTKVIALTGLASAGAQREAFSSGVDMFLTKPVQLRKLKGLLGLG